MHERQSSAVYYTERMKDYGRPTEQTNTSRSPAEGESIEADEAEQTGSETAGEGGEQGSSEAEEARHLE